MSLRSILSPRRAGSIIALAVFSTLSTSAFAADVIKADVADNLELGTAWGGGLTPTVADVALFNSTLAANSTFNLGLAQSWGGIRLTNPSGPITINGTPALTIGSFGIDMSNATQDLTINTPVTIGGGAGIYNWTLAAGRTLTTAALPTKLGHSNNHLGLVKFSTTGTFKLGPAAASNILINNQNNPYALYGDNDWAARDATGTVVTATYTPNTGGVAVIAGANNDIVADSTTANGIDVASLRFADPVARTLLVSTSTTSRTMTARGILVTADSGGGSITNSGVGLTNNNGFIRPARATVANTVFPIIQNSTSDFTIGAIIGNVSSGTATVGTQIVKYGIGKLILTAPNGHPAGTFIEQGTIEVGGTLGTLGGGQVVNNSALILNRTAGTLALGQVISGNGSIEFKGSGIYALSGANTYTAANKLNGGLLEASSAAALGTSNTLNFNGGGYRYNAAYTPDLTTYTTTIGAGGATIDTNGSNPTFAGAFGPGGTGGVTKIGAGTLTLNGANNYSGATTVNGGVLRVNGSIAGSASVANGAFIGGSGIIGGSLTVASGATVSPGTSVGTLTTNGLTLDAGSLLNIEFGAGNDLINAGSGPVTINGGALTLLQENSSTPFSAVGSYNIIQHSASISSISALSVANQQPGYLYTFSDVGGFVKLNVVQNGNVSGWVTNGSGAWGTSSNWAGGIIPTVAGDAAQFSTNLSAASNVTLDGNRAVGGITFNSANGYTILPGSGGTLTLNGNLVPTAQLNAVTGSHAISVPVNMTATTVLSEIGAGAQITVNGAVSGTSALTKSGAGTLSLTNTSNSYSGATTVNGGTLAVGAIGSLGTNPTLNLSGGGVIKYASGMTTDLSTAKTVTLGAGGGGIDTNGNDVTFAASLPGTGGLVKAGTGKLTLSTANAYTGETTVRGGTLSISANDQLGDAAVGAGLTLDGGRLESTATISLTDGAANRTLTVGAAGGSITVADGQTLTVAGNTAGAGQLTMVGNGTTVFAGGSSRTGVTRVESGFIAQTQNGGFGAGQIDLVGGAVLISATDLGPTLNVIGIGGLTGGSGGGTAHLNRLIGGGDLTVSVTTGNIDFNGDMTAFTGTVHVVNAGSGGIRLNGTTLGAGLTLDIGAGVTVARRNTTTSFPIGALTGTGTLTAVTATTGNTTYVIGGKNIDATFDGLVGDTLDATTGAIIASTLITKNGTGKQIFNGENYYTGTTTIQAGTLQLGPNAQTPIFGGTTPISGFPVVGAGADIQGGKLVLDYTGTSSPAANVLSILDAGYDQPTKFLTGALRSTTLATNHLLGWSEDTTTSMVTIAYTIAGDADLSFTVNFDDLLALAQNYSTTGTGKVWDEGDFNYDGSVNFDDLLGLAQNYNTSALTGEQIDTLGSNFSAEWALARSMVPEPTSLGLLAGGLMLTRRRRD